jgi:hypothetical protein
MTRCVPGAGLLKQPVMISRPSLVLKINGTLKGIDIEYLDANYIVKQIIP